MIFIQRKYKQFKYKDSANELHTKTMQTIPIQRKYKQFQYKDNGNDFHTKVSKQFQYNSSSNVNNLNMKGTKR